MLNRVTVKQWVARIAAAIPCETDEQLERFIAARPEGKFVAPRAELEVGDHWFSFRRYRDAVTGGNILEVYVGSRESGSEFMGYDRLDPNWQDAEGRDLERWEITRAYMRPKYRGRNYSLFMAELAMALCRKNHSRSVVAYPRHVAMLVTLLSYGFKTMEGDYDHTLMRILKQGRKWYGGNAAQRRLYYAQEFRPFIQDGSFIMEKRVGPSTLWEFLWQKV
ncbi:MAG: hypothetical protein ABIK37_01685 [candidate division WOR-3 bacterium]